jgi:hypothetical protein
LIVWDCPRRARRRCGSGGRPRSSSATSLGHWRSPLVPFTGYSRPPAAGKIADEILSHLSTLPGARLRVSDEIEAEISDGTPEDVQRTVSENAGVLKFDSHGFERE